MLYIYIFYVTGDSNQPNFFTYTLYIYTYTYMYIYIHIYISLPRTNHCHSLPACAPDSIWKQATNSNVLEKVQYSAQEPYPSSKTVPRFLRVRLFWLGRRHSAMYSFNTTTLKFNMRQAIEKKWPHWAFLFAYKVKRDNVQCASAWRKRWKEKQCSKSKSWTASANIEVTWHEHACSKNVKVNSDISVWASVTWTPVQS